MLFGLPDKFWQHHYYSSLQIKDLLSLIQCCKYFNKQKNYIYRLIYCKIINIAYLEIDYQISYPRVCTDLNIHSNNVKVITEILTLLNNNEYMRNMFIRSNSKRESINVLRNIVKNIYDKKNTIHIGCQLYIKFRNDLL